MTTSVHPPSRVRAARAAASAATGRATRVLLADRGDPLVDSLSAAMRARFDVVGHLDTELSTPERLLVAASTFAPRRRHWAERFYKSNLGVELRTRRARRGLADQRPAAEVIFQTHALFEIRHPRTVLYIDCTHRQSMRQWPEWNPLRGPDLERWLIRERRQYQSAAHVFAFSAETARSIVEDYHVAEDRVSVVGAGVNFDRLPVLGRGFTPPPTILFVGNDFERKGGRALLDAFARVRVRIPEARLRIVGTPYRVPAQDGVEQLGRISSREQMSRLYVGADVFCLPSYYDPYPGALLEAMAHGLPSVVTRTCGVPEMIDEGVTALSVDRGPAMVPELAASLEHLLRHRDRAAQMGLQARWRVEDRFLWSQVVDRMAPVIERLAGPVHRTTTRATPTVRPTTHPGVRS